MKKDDVTSFSRLVEFARERAVRSLKRNDPWAWAYWRETEAWAARVISKMEVTGDPDKDREFVYFQFVFSNLHTAERSQEEHDKLYGFTRFLVEAAQALLAKGEITLAARTYSRAKWLVIIARNTGWTMPPEKTGVNLDWLRRFEEYRADMLAAIGVKTV